MLKPLSIVGCVLASSFLLTACSSGGAGSAAPVAPAPVPSATPAMTMSSGMVMTAADMARPSKAAAMVCTDEVRKDLRTILATTKVPAGQGNWAPPVYSCTYRLAVGDLHLSVHEAPDEGSATSEVRRRRAELGGGTSLLGLGPDGYAPTDGVVLLRKDNDVLEVDARGLPEVFGSNEQHRKDFAFELATDILGCWTGDDDS